jgi:hypothetical protein
LRNAADDLGRRRDIVTESCINRFKALLGAGVLLCGPVLVLAQTPAPSVSLVQTEKDAPLVSSERTVNLTEKNRYITREIILKDPGVPKEEEEHRVEIGDALPPDIATKPFLRTWYGKFPPSAHLDFSRPTTRS